MDRLDISDSECSESSESNGNTSSSESSDSNQSEPSTIATEPAKILKQTIELPKGLCEDVSIFEEFFSVTTLRELDPDIQSHLQQFLPKFSDHPVEDAVEKQRTLMGLFGGGLDRFGSTPLSDLQRNLEDGNYRPDIASYRAAIKKSQRREHRFQECERTSRLAKSIMIARGNCLKFAYDSVAGTSVKVNHNTAPNPIASNTMLTSSVAAQRSKKRYFNEIASIATECGLREEAMTDDESYPGEATFQITRKQRRQLNGTQGGAMSPGSESRVQSTTAPRDGCLDHLMDIGGSFALTDDFYRQSIYQHKKRKMDEPDHPELMTRDVELVDILTRTHLSASDRRALLQAKPVVKKTKIKLETPTGISTEVVQTNEHIEPHINQNTCNTEMSQCSERVQSPPPPPPPAPSAVSIEIYPDESSSQPIMPPANSIISDCHTTTLPSAVFRHSPSISTSFDQKLTPPTTLIHQQLFADQPQGPFKSESESEEENPIKPEPISPPPTPIRILTQNTASPKTFSNLSTQQLNPISSKLIISLSGNMQPLAGNIQPLSAHVQSLSGNVQTLNKNFQSSSGNKHSSMLQPKTTQSPAPNQIIESDPAPLSIKEEVFTIMAEPEISSSIFHIKSESDSLSSHLPPIQATSIHLPQYGGKVKPATLSDLEGIDMMHLPVDLDDSGNIGILNEMEVEDVDVEIEHKEEPEPESELMQDTHSSFFSLIRDIFCSTPNHRTTIDHLHEKISAWLANPITALNDWYIEAENWLEQIPSAIQFMAGELNEQPEDFVPYVEYKSQLCIYQWIGAGRDSDQHLNPLCEFWLKRRNETANTTLRATPPVPLECQPRVTKQVSITEGEDSGSSSNFERPASPLPPRCPTAWTVAKANDAEIEEFREQERIRFNNPHLSFTYRLHGFESVVGPVKGIYTQIPVLTKARGHTMLTADRPNFVTILTLVRDATARLPNGEGTRSDICELLRSSQYINPDAADNVLQTIVSGALDRMHTEHDPCVRYDSKRKIWIYLHRNRSEEEFEKMHQQFQGVSKHKKQTSRKVKGKSLIKSPVVPSVASPVAGRTVSPLITKTVSSESPIPAPKILSPSSMPTITLVSSAPVNITNTPSTTITNATPIFVVPPIQVHTVPAVQSVKQPAPIQVQQPVQVQMQKPVHQVPPPLQMQVQQPMQMQLQQPVQMQLQQPINVQQTTQKSTTPNQVVHKTKPLQKSDQLATQTILVTTSQPISITQPPSIQLPALSSIQQPVQTPPILNKLAASKKSLVKADLIPIKVTNPTHKFEKIENIDIEATLDAHNPSTIITKTKTTQVVQSQPSIVQNQTAQKALNFNVDNKPIPVKKATKLVMSSPTVITTSVASTVAHSITVNNPVTPQIQYIHQNSANATSTIKIVQQTPVDTSLATKPTLNVTLAKQADTHPNSSQNIVVGHISQKASMVKSNIIHQPSTSLSMSQPQQQQSILIQNQSIRSQTPIVVSSSNIIAGTTKKIIKPQLVQQQQQHQPQPQQPNQSTGTNFVIPINVSGQQQSQKMSPASTGQSQTNNITAVTQSPKPIQKPTGVPGTSGTTTKGVSLLQQVNSQKPIVRTTNIQPGKSLINPSVVAANLSIQQHQQQQPHQQQQQSQKPQNFVSANLVSIHGRTSVQSSTIMAQKLISTTTTRNQTSTLTTAQQRQILQNIIAQQKTQRLQGSSTINLVPGSVIVSSPHPVSQQSQPLANKPILVSQTNAGGFVQRIIVSSAAPNSIVFSTISSTAVPPSTTMTLAGSGQTSKSSTTLSTASIPSGTVLSNRPIIQIQQNPNQLQPQSSSTISKVQTVSTSNMTPQQQQTLLQSIKQQQIRVLNQQATATPQQQTLIVKQQQVLQQIQKQLQHQQLNNTIKPGTSLLNPSSGTIITSLSTSHTTPTTTSSTQTMTRIIRPGVMRQQQIVQPVASQTSTSSSAQPTISPSQVNVKSQSNSGQIISLESLLQKQGQNIGSGTTLRVAGPKLGQGSIIQLSGASATAATQYAVVSQGLHGRSTISLTSAPQKLNTNPTSSSAFGTTLLKPIVDSNTRSSSDQSQPQPYRVVQHALASSSSSSSSNTGQTSQLVNSKVLGIQSVGATTRIRPTGIRMMNTANVNIANIAGKPIIISNKTNGPQLQQSPQSSQPHPQLSRPNVIWQNASSVPNNPTTPSSNTTTTTNFLIGGQTVKVHGNLLQHLDQQQQQQQQTGTPRSTATTQAIMFGNQMVKLQPTSNNNSNSTGSQSQQQQQQQQQQSTVVQQPQHVINNLSNATTTFMTQGGTTRTVVLGQTGQTIRVHSPAQQPSTNSTTVGPNVKNTTIKGTQLASVAGQQRVVLAVQGGGQILLPPGFQGSSINLKSLQGLKVIPMVQQNQSKDASNVDRPKFAQIITAPKGPRPPNSSSTDS